jgi:DNA-binding NtrC family response regulator
MSRGHILLVDDEVSILKTFRQLLEVEGYSVAVAGGFNIAREKLASCQFDLGLFDVALPDGNGIELLRGLRRDDPDARLPVIMMSGHAQAEQMGDLRYTWFFDKASSTDLLLLEIDKALRLSRAELALKQNRRRLLGTSPAMLELQRQLSRAAKSNATILLRGERGTGKELAARAIHEQSRRADGPLEKLNCAAVPNELIESELFGHEAGAFTGATKERRGKFERASGGTLFLDEVGDMPLPMQAKLLRVLQERELERVGGSKTIAVDVRVVAATNRDLEQACAEGDFRPDLYDRLNVLPLRLPPLRTRREDVQPLVTHFLAQLAAENDRPGMQFSGAALEALRDYDFPGNVRELRNAVERLVILTHSDTIELSDVNNCIGHGAPAARGLYRPGFTFRSLVEDAERTILSEAIRHHGDQMTATARALGLERSHLYKKCKALGLRGQQSSSE